MVCSAWHAPCGQDSAPHQPPHTPPHAGIPVRHSVHMLHVRSSAAPTGIMSFKISEVRAKDSDTATGYFIERDVHFPRLSFTLPSFTATARCFAPLGTTMTVLGTTAGSASHATTHGHPTMTVLLARPPAALPHHHTWPPDHDRAMDRCHHRRCFHQARIPRTPAFSTHELLPIASTAVHHTPVARVGNVSMPPPWRAVAASKHSSTTE